MYDFLKFFSAIEQNLYKWKILTKSPPPAVILRMAGTLDAATPEAAVSAKLPNK